MRKAIIKTRAVYHKIAEVTIEIPNHISDDEVQDYILSNENMFVDELDSNLHDAPMAYGFGLGDDFEEKESASETRYDLYENEQIIFGGHL